MSEPTKTYQSGSSPGFVGLLTITFVVLKALGYLTWSWIWVFSPLWISAGVILFLLFIWGTLLLAANYFDNRALKARRKRLASKGNKGSTTGTRG